MLKKLLLFDHDDQRRFLESSGLQKNRQRLLQFYETKLSLRIAPIGFLHLRPILLISLVFPSLPILILFMTCAAKRGSQLRNGLSSARRTLVFCSAEIRRVPTLSFHFSHSHFHTTVVHVNLLQAVLAESLPLLHMRESPHLGFRAWFINAFQNVCESQDL